MIHWLIVLFVVAGAVLATALLMRRWARAEAHVAYDRGYARGFDNGKIMGSTPAGQRDVRAAAERRFAMPEGTKPARITRRADPLPSAEHDDDDDGFTNDCEG